MAYGGLPFPDTGCPVPDVANINLVRQTNWTIYYGPPLYQVYTLKFGWSVGVFQATQPIPFPMYEPLVSCMVAQCRFKPASDSYL